MYIQWFPGHMTKALRMMRESASQCDVLLYVVDCRAVKSCLNPAFSELLCGKRALYILNKSDLVEKSDLKRWIARFEAENKACLAAVGTSVKSSEIVLKIKSLMADVLEKYREKGVNKPIRAMVIGVPNSGKSTIVNSMLGRAAAQTGNRPGVTRGKQWIAMSGGIDLLDTPGTLWAKFDDQATARRLAYIGSISDDILDVCELAAEFLREASERYGNLIIKRYSLEKLSQNPRETLVEIAKNRGYKISGGELDITRAANAVMDDFRKARLGKIMLEYAD
jgi:ribosome biogenesis GTPase A